MMSNLTEHPINTDSIENRYHELFKRLRSAETRFGRAPGSVCLVAIGKTRAPEAIRTIAELRQKDFGENQLQEALGKIEILSDLDCTWHFIGSIQTNKCRDIAAHFDWIHSVDRLKIARRLSNLRLTTAAPLNIFLQVNLQGEATKSGITPGELTALASAVSELPNLQLRGLMVIPVPEPSFERQRKVFGKLRELQNALNGALDLGLDCLSMGMTDDLEAAVAEGATHVRVGTAIFGPRKPHKQSESAGLEKHSFNDLESNYE